MNSNRVNLMTLSAALAGLALTVFTPAAHGHGNNPKLTSDTDPDTSTTPPPPPDTISPNIDFEGSLFTPAALDSILDPGIVIGVDVTLLDSGDVLSSVLADPASIPIGVPISPSAPDLWQQVPLDIIESTPMGSITSPMSNVVPAPGTLALIGLAGLAASRRRRRR